MRFFVWDNMSALLDSTEEDFTFWMPAQAISKSSSGKAKHSREIQGIASTAASDLQAESVIQSGIDFSYFLKHGFFNNDHKEGFKNKVGEPLECKVTKNGLWVKGFLYEGKSVSDDIWEMMTSLEKTSGAKRKIGFSIQGKVKRRSGRVIDECWIQDIAITPCPVNTHTWAEIVKSLSADKWADKDKSADKALTSASALVPESLDKKTKDTVTSEDEPSEDINKSLTFKESVDYIRKSTNMAPQDAESACRVLFSLLGETNE
jgi:hypothetical protein